MKRIIVTTALFLALIGVSRAQDPGWPRQITKPTGTLVYYQPQVDEWKAFTDLTWRMAFTFTPSGGKQTVGVVEMQGHTTIDDASKTVLISDLKVLGTHFPSLDSATAAQMGERLKTFVPPVVTISLFRLVAVSQKPESSPAVPVQNDPPAIVISYRPAVLVSVEGQPELVAIPKTKVKFVVIPHGRYLSTSKPTITSGGATLDDRRQPERSVGYGGKTPEGDVQDNRRPAVGRIEESDSASTTFWCYSDDLL